MYTAIIAVDLTIITTATCIVAYRLNRAVQEASALVNGVTGPISGLLNVIGNQR